MTFMQLQGRGSGSFRELLNLESWLNVLFGRDLNTVLNARSALIIIIPYLVRSFWFEIHDKTFPVLTLVIELYCQQKL